MVDGAYIRNRGRPGIRRPLRLLAVPLILALCGAVSADDTRASRGEPGPGTAVGQSTARIDLRPSLTCSRRDVWSRERRGFFDTHFLPTLYRQLSVDADFEHGVGQATGDAAQSFLLEQPLVLRLREHLENEWNRRLGHASEPSTAISQPLSPTADPAATATAGRARVSSNFDFGLSSSGPEVSWNYRRGPTSLRMLVDASQSLVLEYRRNGRARSVASLNADFDPLSDRYSVHCQILFGRLAPAGPEPTD